MLNGIRPPDFWIHLQTVLPRLDEEAHDGMHALSSRARDGSFPPAHDASDMLQRLLEQAVIRPRVPLQVWGYPTTPASEDVTCLGPVGSATMARRVAARRYSLLEAESSSTGGGRKRLQHLAHEVLVFLELATVLQYSAHLPKGYEPIPRPSTATPPRSGMHGGHP